MLGPRIGGRYENNKAAPMIQNHVLKQKESECSAECVDRDALSF